MVKVVKLRELSVCMRIQVNWLAVWFSLDRKESRAGGGERLAGDLAFKGPEILIMGRYSKHGL